ncbi:MAG: DegT/DnrJ/EryC1/StrS family aminotransferase [Pseudomonadota bacterium]|nr:DegT/DnrJ/EryC1/StrS family aminotransferase [Pseudomonadota bacterium]
MLIPFQNLAADNTQFVTSFLNELSSTICSGQYVNGHQVHALEDELAEYLDAPEVVTVNSGTDALRLSLEALGIGKGHEVIVASYSFVATTAVVASVGATPVFGDCSLDDFTIDVKHVQRLINARTRAIIPVHLFGNVADVESLNHLAKAHKIKIIEDCAQAFGARNKNGFAGTLGDTGAFSFYPTKVLGGLGDGGAICTNDASLALHLRRLRNHGQDSNGVVKHLGHNSRLDEMQAAMLRVKLLHIDKAIESRRHIAEKYRANLSGCDLKLPLPTQRLFSQFVIRTEMRDQLAAYLSIRGIETRCYYTLPCHKIPAFHDAAQRLELPHAEELARTSLALPIYTSLTEALVMEICKAIQEFFE